MKMRTEDIDKKIGMPDIDKEWEKFVSEVIEEKNTTIRMPIFRRIAAVATVLLGLSCLAVASVWVVNHIEDIKTDKELNEQQSATTQSSTKNCIEDEKTAPDVFLFDNVEMEEIATTLGKYYNVEVVFETEEVKHVRMYLQIDKGESLEQIIKMLNNFKKVNITLEGGRLIIK